MGTGREVDGNWKRSRWELELEEKGMGTGREVDGNWKSK